MAPNKYQNKEESLDFYLAGLQKEADKGSPTRIIKEINARFGQQRWGEESPCSLIHLLEPVADGWTEMISAINPRLPKCLQGIGL